LEWDKYRKSKDVSPAPGVVACGFLSDLRHGPAHYFHTDTTTLILFRFDL